MCRKTVSVYGFAFVQLHELLDYLHVITRQEDVMIAQIARIEIADRLLHLDAKLRASDEWQFGIVDDFPARDEILV